MPTDTVATRSLAPFLRRERKAWAVIDGLMRQGKTEHVRLDAAKFVMSRIYPEKIEHSGDPVNQIRIIIQIPSPTGEEEYRNPSNRLKDLLPNASAN